MPALLLNTSGPEQTFPFGAPPEAEPAFSSRPSLVNSLLKAELAFSLEPDLLESSLWRIQRQDEAAAHDFFDEPTSLGTINRREQETWPPVEVILSDHNVRLVILAEITGKDRGKLRPINFTGKGWIKQTGFGQSAKEIDKDGRQRYWLQGNKWELCGQEGFDIGPDGRVVDGEDQDLGTPKFSFGTLCVGKKKQKNSRSKRGRSDGDMNNSRKTRQTSRKSPSASGQGLDNFHCVYPAEFLNFIIVPSLGR